MVKKSTKRQELTGSAAADKDGETKLDSMDERESIA